MDIYVDRKGYQRFRKSKNMLIVPTDDDDYTGIIKVVNEDNADDYDEIPVSLSVSKNQGVYFHGFL